MNGLIIASIAIHVILTALLGLSGEYPGGLVAAMAVSILVSIFGGIMIATGARKPGAIIVIIGCVMFVPIGGKTSKVNINLSDLEPGVGDELLSFLEAQAAA